MDRVCIFGLTFHIISLVYLVARECCTVSRALHDVKATDLGGQFVRFKAEVDFDGKEVARCYLEKQDLDILFKVNIAPLCNNCSCYI